MVKTLPAMLETWVRALGWEDLLGKATATHSSILTWRIPWTEEPGKAVDRLEQWIEPCKRRPQCVPKV